MPDTIHTSGTSTAFALDGVAITLETTFLPGEFFMVAERGDELQAAVWATIQPASELTIIAVPFGTKPPTENVPPAAPGIEDQYYDGFDKARKDGEVQVLARSSDGPAITLFGNPVTGRVVLVSAVPDDVESPPTLTVEWVAEAGQRLWIVRASQEMAPGTKTLGQVSLFLNSLADITLSSDTLDQPTTLKVMSDSGRPGTSLVPSDPGPLENDADDALAADELPMPPWWNGVCNLNNFRPVTHVASFPMNSGF